MTKLVIQDRMVPLYSYVDSNPPQRTTKYAGKFDQSCNEMLLYVIDWKITGDKVWLTYMTRDDSYASIYDQAFDLITIKVPVSKPGRSKNWTWNELSSHWFNKCTGERVSVI